MALNKILQGIVRDFQTKYSLDGEESKVFEHLANYILYYHGCAVYPCQSNYMYPV